MEVKIKQGEEMIDATIEMVDGVMVVSPKEVKFEPKDGDVVYAGGFYDFVFIYKDNLTAEAYYYVSLFLKTNKIDLPDGGHIGYVSQLRPATEEEKKKLFDKLAEEGLAWDAERKELVKIKWKPKEGEPYFSPIFSNIDFLFSTCSHLYTGHFTDEMTIKKMRAFRTKDECQLFCDKLNQTIEEYER